MSRGVQYTSISLAPRLGAVRPVTSPIRLVAPVMTMTCSSRGLSLIRMVDSLSERQ
jgi:hypothetical protein